MAVEKVVSKLNVADRYYDLTVATGETIQPGEFVALATGEAATGTTTSVIITGWSDDSSARTAAELVRVAEGRRWCDFTATLDADDIGQPAYLSSANAVKTAQAAAEPVVGTIIAVTATQALVEITLVGNALWQKPDLT